ncbi:ABC transporter ATPase [Burkholderia aenigmatica]|uniref:ABC transporter ATPase n=2 Tax=Burkholderiaceae TaxID=119060 RepID=A0A6P2HI06_9BURK|nr:ABC transporter ATPase [Burkholderia aenigmatica]
MVVDRLAGPFRLILTSHFVPRRAIAAIHALQVIDFDPERGFCDREFVSGLANRIIEVRTDGTLFDFGGNYEEFLTSQGQE